MAVIGLGNSGADVAGEISRLADQVWCHILILLLGVSLIPAETESRFPLALAGMFPFGLQGHVSLLTKYE